MNDIKQAFHGEKAIRNAYKSNLENNYPDEKFKFKTAYNHSKSMLADLYEVIEQKIDETGGLSAHNLLKIARKPADQELRLLKELAATTDESKIIVDEAIEAIAETRKIFLSMVDGITDSALRMADASNIHNTYRTNLQSGIRVIIISHSQGNMFTNEAVKSINQSDSEYSGSIGTIGVGNPASELVNGQHVTANDDYVIIALKAFDWDVLGTNCSNDPGWIDDPRDLFNHGFKPSYFRSFLKSRNMINERFNNLISTLEFPEPILGNGAIKVALTWGAEPDLDLHIYEPNGTHVYYRNRQGVSGFLDVDDTSSFGPEHYFVECQDIEEGVYQFCVNYYYGTGTETANIILLTADGKTRTTSRRFYSSEGSSGNSNPTIMGKIEVSKDTNDNYQFKIII